MKREIQDAYTPFRRAVGWYPEEVVEENDQMSDLKAYLDYKKENERINREISEVERLIAVKKKELEKLQGEKDDLVYQARDTSEVMRKMEEEAQK